MIESIITLDVPKMNSKSKFSVVISLELRCNVKFCRTTIEEWTPNEKGGFDIAVSEPMVNDYEYYPFAIPVSHDYIELECLGHS